MNQLHEKAAKTPIGDQLRQILHKEQVRPLHIKKIAIGQKSLGHGLSHHLKKGGVRSVNTGERTGEIGSKEQEKKRYEQTDYYIAEVGKLTRLFHVQGCSSPFE